MSREIKINGKTISSEPYVIAEIGCNHCGNFDIALEMVRVATFCGVDAVKFQKRTPEEVFTKAELDKPYDSPHSYGKTYGEHRKCLDWFGTEQYLKLKDYAKQFAVDFIITPFSQVDADIVNEIGVDAFKVASCDLNHEPMLKQIKEYGKPIILSTGGGTLADIQLAINWLGRANVALLHCVSNYPVADYQLNLNNLLMLRKNFSNVIGFSSHHPGLLPHYIAYMLGALIFEVHFTLNRGWKGTDHGFSLEPDGLRRLCADLRRIDTMHGSFERKVGEKTGFVKKFGKTWHAACGIMQSETITPGMLCLLGPAEGFVPNEIFSIVGYKANDYIPQQSAIKPEMISK